MPFLFYFNNDIANDKLFLSNVTIRLFEHCRSTSNIDDTLAELTLVRLVFAIESLVGNNNTLCPIDGSRASCIPQNFSVMAPSSVVSLEGESFRGRRENAATRRVWRIRESRS